MWCRKLRQCCRLLVTRRQDEALAKDDFFCPRDAADDGCQRSRLCLVPGSSVTDSGELSATRRQPSQSQTKVGHYLSLWQLSSLLVETNWQVVGAQLASLCATLARLYVCLAVYIQTRRAYDWVVLSFEVRGVNKTMVRITGCLLNSMRGHCRLGVGGDQWWWHRTVEITFSVVFVPAVSSSFWMYFPSAHWHCYPLQYHFLQLTDIVVPHKLGFALIISYKTSYR